MKFAARPGAPVHPGERRVLLSVALAVALVAGVLALMESGSNGERVDADPRSAEWVCANQPERIRALFDELDLDRPGLGGVKTAVLSKDYPAACGALLDYYRTAPTAQWLRLPPPAESGKTWRHADIILTDTLYFYNMPGKLARTGSGGIRWSDQGPRDQPEWRWALNTLMYCKQLFYGYQHTGRRDYVERIDADLRDWVLANPCPGRLDVRGNWRGIEMTARVRVWMQLFYGLQAADEFSPAARLLMLSSLLDHAHQLMLFHRRGATNWAVSELSGLAIIACAWPEFNDAAGWREYATENISRQIDGQVYPDGAQMELTSMYQRITAETFDSFLGVLREFGYEAPDSLASGVERMWNYIAYSIRPDASTPENNDAERQVIRDKVLHAADVYRRPDWEYIVTNGQRGQAPDGPPTRTFPWAGHTVMRGGWEEGAQWAFFDAGPYGTAHQHRDKLHLSIDAFGRALLVDGARYNYGNDAFREYFVGSAAHNVIRIDGRDQEAGPERATEPAAATEYGSFPGWDYARGMFASGYEGVRGQAIHTRAVVYVRNEFWVVADRIETDRPRTVEVLWHFAPDCRLSIDDRAAVTDDPDTGNLRIAPVGGVAWHAEVVAGSEKPVQGWYSPVYNEKTAAPVAVYTADIPGTTTFAWVIVPARGPVSPADAAVISSRAERIELRVQPRPGVSYVVTVPMNAWKPSVRRRD